MLREFIVRHKERWRFLKPAWLAYRRVLGAIPWRWLPVSSRVIGPPKGFHATTADYLAGAAADPRDRVHPIAPARTLEYPAPHGRDAAEHWKFRQFARQSVPAASVFELHDVRLWGDYAGTLIGRDDRVLGDLTRDVWEVQCHRIFTRLKLPPCRRLSGTTAVLTTAEADRNYWHWTLELLPRLNRLERAGFAPADFDWYVINHRDRGYERESLEQLGVKWERVVRADAHLHVELERAVTASLKSHQYAVTAEDVAFLRAMAVAQWPAAKPHRRLYLSRSGAGFRRLQNEAEVLAVLEPLGFEVVRGETLSVAGQQRAFREAAVVVGPHGSALANAIYCQRDTKVLEFMSPRYIDLAMWAGSSAAGLEHWVLFGEGPRPPEGVDPMARQQDIAINVGSLRETLRAMQLC
ncbi:MAG TPA: glycosyltransferase 61 family protein [Opitutus sp.]|nr:glycosyltransferase 61 family protein [Opitutus sp.]